ncbi:uncharacterized protein BO88DRAFT_218646 [Aspergillus vadensis CBS 113365]|uniref:Uncharacterized protein n=1 Tax=Aspergillus vadensis (strain CBS 113365 / IMI 142717 / IBT 24658) TaxID=1448311 RepID=A0A319BAT5_ASPVC|nr:hypothetical protein BO88DRAFT_218646 [Aspergillus vadensis CBS 113365]PYH63513.1 hypothetical protein BO88DRAFT_218646 [Aspergillus vadensis CBS 113365]
MSRSSSAVLHQSSRCATKIPRHSNIFVSSAPVITSSSFTSAASSPLFTNSVPASTTESSLSIEPSASNTWHSTAAASAVLTDATTTQSLQPSVVDSVVEPTTIASVTLADPSDYNLIQTHTEDGTHFHMPVSAQTRSISSYQTQPPTSDSSTSVLSSITSTTSTTQYPHTTSTSFIPHSAVTSAVTSANSSSHGYINQSDHGGSHASLRAILGGVLGGVAFVALALAIGYFVMRHKRRKPRDELATGTSEEHLQDDDRSPAASSAGSHQVYQSCGSSFTDHSSTPSSPLRAMFPVFPAKSYQAHRTPSGPNLLSDANPFLDSAEIKYVSRGSGVPSNAGTLRNPFADAAPSHTVVIRQSYMSQRPTSTAWYSMHSDRSLGSTLHLPGRSSAGSSLQRLSYPFTAAELEACEPMARLSTRSDPFDLECPPHAMHRRSSTVIPIGHV